MKIFKLLQKYFGMQLVTYLDDDEGGAWGDDDDKGEGWSDDDDKNWESWKGEWKGKGEGAGGEGDDWDNTQTKLDNWKAMNKRKRDEATAAAAKDKKPEGGKGGDDAWDSKKGISDEDLDKHIDNQIALGIAAADKDRTTKEHFFSQMQEAGEILSDVWLTYNKNISVDILRDIEKNGFQPEDLIFLQNKESILEKLSVIPKQAMSSDSGNSFKPKKPEGNMTDYVANLRKGM